MWNLIKSLFGGKDGGSPIGQLAIDIRQAIKGKEVDPDTALRYIQELNAAEARHRSTFVAGWRPAIGWVGALVMLYHYILQPIGVWALHLNGIYDVPPSLDLDSLWPIITGMLGIAGMRSYDKKQGKA